MTWLQKFVNWAGDFFGISADTTFADTTAGSLLNKATGAGLTGAEREANAFTADQAALQREWSSAEAERARDWNEEMYAKYNSLSGKIAQADEAGVNPMFSVTGNSVSPMQTGASAPSGASAGSVSPTGHGLTDLIGSILGLMKSKSDIEVNESISAKNNAEANKTSEEASWIDSLSQAQLDNLVASTDELSSRLGVNFEKANTLKAEFSKLIQETSRIAQITNSEKRNLEAQAALAEFQTDNQGLFKGLDLGSDVLNMVVQVATALIEKKTKTTIVK